MPNTASHPVQLVPEMKFVERRLAPSGTHDDRRYVFYPGFRCHGLDCPALLSIVQGKQKDHYGIEEPLDMSGVVAEAFPPLPPMPRFFVIEKLTRAKSESDRDGPYCVRIAQGAGVRDECQCFGYNTNQTCKHIDTLRDLVRMGDL